MSEKKATATEIQHQRIRAIQSSHQWAACQAIQEAFGRNDRPSDQIDWGLIAKAAYHAGAAKALYDATF